jgi:hypothetical protein
MAAIVPAPPVAVTSSLRRSAPRMAKVDLRKAEVDAHRQLIGRALDRARQLRGWNLDEFADAVARDPRQVARWFAGTERAQFDAIFAVVSLRQPVIVAFAEIAGEGVEVETVVRVRRKVA